MPTTIIIVVSLSVLWVFSIVLLLRWAHRKELMNLAAEYEKSGEILSLLLQACSKEGYSVCYADADYYYLLSDDSMFALNRQSGERVYARNLDDILKASGCETVADLMDTMMRQWDIQITIDRTVLSPKIENAFVLSVKEDFEL